MPIENPKMTPLCPNCNEPTDIYTNLKNESHLACSNCPTVKSLTKKEYKEIVRSQQCLA